MSKVVIGGAEGMFDPGAEIDRLIAEQIGWSWFDDHVLYTCGVVDFLMKKQLAHIRPQATRVRLEADERCLAEGPAAWSVWQAVGDGSWTRRTIYAAGSLSFVAAAHIGNALANQSRRRRAEYGLQPRWVPARPGLAMVSQRRVFFHNPGHSFSIYWSGLDMVDLIGPDRLEFRYRDRHGTPQALRAQSPWAILMFALAAHTQFPNHPLLLSGNWLPSGFEDKCHIAGKTCPHVRFPSH
ncbi:hypothetical protein ACQP1G_04935 [Nocardia sp. CA-107356]|uniref:hypothetical protein n=1 Tax=Nocardia sp. CA-107356 TaxID=3239972 RepID=UPI003D942B78